MSFFLDSDICIYYMNGYFPKIENRICGLLPDRIKIAAIVKAELLYGAVGSNDPARSRQKVTALVDHFEIIPFSDSCTDTHARIRAELQRAGRVIGPNDFILAATVLANDGILVTHNTGEFSRVPGLQIQDWTQ